MITDRRRLGGDGLSSEMRVVRQVRAGARAGLHLVQIRERDLEGGALVRLAMACVEAVEGTRTRVLVNDRVDVALAAGAHGVHLRADSMPAARVRSMVPPGFIVGRSVHGVDDAAAAVEGGGLDYLLAGTIFPTPSKAGRAAAGPELLRAIVAVSPVPVLAVGGVTPENVSAVAATGADGMAAIGAFGGDPAMLGSVIEEMVAAFDTPRTVP